MNYQSVHITHFTALNLIVGRLLNCVIELLLYCVILIFLTFAINLMLLSNPKIICCFHMHKNSKCCTLKLTFKTKQLTVMILETQFYTYCLIILAFVVALPVLQCNWLENAFLGGNVNTCLRTFQLCQLSTWLPAVFFNQLSGAFSTWNLVKILCFGCFQAFGWFIIRPVNLGPE